MRNEVLNLDPEQIKQHLELRKELPKVEETFPALFKAHKDSMVGVAANAETRAEHWNKVHIGCCIITLNKDLDPAEPAFYAGANRKHSSEMLAFPNRMCGEMEAFVNALGLKGQIISL